MYTPWFFHMDSKTWSFWVDGNFHFPRRDMLVSIPNTHILAGKNMDSENQDSSNNRRIHILLKWSFSNLKISTFQRRCPLKPSEKVNKEGQRLFQHTFGTHP